MADDATIYSDDGFWDFVGAIDLDAFLERMSELAGESRRRAVGSYGRPVGRERTSADDRRKPKRPKIDLVLYTSAASEKSQKALRAVREVLRGYESSQVKFSTCDLSVHPQDADVDSVMFTPTLVKQGPGPRTSIIGNLEDRDILRDLLDSSGVERRWDD